jgi:hypothetical protein
MLLPLPWKSNRKVKPVYFHAIGHIEPTHIEPTHIEPTINTPVQQYRLFRPLPEEIERPYQVWRCLPRNYLFLYAR